MLIKETDITRERNLLMNLLQEFGFSSIRSFQKFAGLVVDGLFGNNSYKALYKHILNPVELGFTDFVSNSSVKTQIVWHHSAGWDNARGMYDGWKMDSRGKVATAVGIEDSGKIYRGFDEQYCAYHLGCKQKDFDSFDIPNIGAKLDMQSIGVEVCSAGSLDDNGKSWFGYTPPADRIVEVNYRGYKLFESITDEECKTLKYWTLLNAIRFSIPVYYKEFDMWNLSKDALTNVPGIYTHNSYRTDKNDISPQENVIAMAKSLQEYYL